VGLIRAMETKHTITDSLPHIGRAALPTSIMEILTNYLLSGELKPGDKLPTEVDLAQKLGVGRNSVREAIKMLSAVGVVEAIRGSGIYIARSVSASMLNPLILGLVFEQGTSHELIQLRLLLDTGAAEIALEHIHDNEIESLEAINLQLEKEGKKRKHNQHRLRDLDLSFHKELYRISGNRLLAKVGEAIYKLFYASIEKTVEADPEKAYQNHKMIIDAMKKRDPSLVRKSTKASLSYWMNYISTKQI
jgi:GntR family transcriptional repressor for pyruvate dehydrogenase complex